MESGKNKTKKRFTISNDGYVHLLSPVGSDSTLCGDGREGENGHGDESEPLAWTSTTTSSIVTCFICKLIIKECRGVKTN